MRKIIIILLLFNFTTTINSQVFENFNNVESIFKMPKKSLEKLIIDNYGYHLKLDNKNDVKTYLKDDYYIHLFYDKTGLILFDWNDKKQSADTLITQIKNFKIIPEKTDKYIGIQTIVSHSKGLELTISKSKPNIDKGTISFGLRKIPVDSAYKSLRLKSFEGSLIEDPAEFIGGREKYREYIKSKLLENHLDKEHGKIEVYFYIENDGKISTPRFYLTPRNTLKLESTKKIIEIFAEMPNWKPAKYQNIPIRSQQSFEITL